MIKSWLSMTIGVIVVILTLTLLTTYITPAHPTGPPKPPVVVDLGIVQFPSDVNNGYWVYTKARWNKLSVSTREIIITQWISGFIAGYPYALMQMGYTPVMATVETTRLFHKVNAAKLHPKQMVSRMAAWYGKYPLDSDPSVVFFKVFTQFLDITVVE